jgi:exopolysaccharide biosynthesis predicted pyruvyltransferase EpsI
MDEKVRGVTRSDDTLLVSLRHRVIDDVRRVVTPGPVALLDFPDYENPGDSAIWLGALACLAELGLEPPVYTSDDRTFDERALRRAMPHGTILINGGGNLGDLWPRPQVLRERVIRAFPEHAIVQLPQTVHFGDAAALSRARTTLRAHSNLTILVRDARSLEVATADLGCRAKLCPDLAFALSPELEPALRVEPSRTIETLYLLRTDHEGNEMGDLKVRGVDWVAEPRTPLVRAFRGLSSALARLIERDGNVMTIQHLLRRSISATYTPLARARLRRGCQRLKSARVVVTDRLHGHILALLLRVPHVVLGDRNGKVRGFVDAWTSSSSLMRWAESPSEAEVLARELVS